MPDRGPICGRIVIALLGALSVVVLAPVMQWR